MKPEDLRGAFEATRQTLDRRMRDEPGATFVVVEIDRRQVVVRGDR